MVRQDMGRPTCKYQPEKPARHGAGKAGGAMPLSVREALTLGVLRRAVLLTGERGLDRPVEWVEVLETPDGARWVRPRSLVLTTFYALKDDPGAQRTAVDQLISVGASGLAVALRPGVRLATEVWLPPAEAADFPVVQLPPDVAYWQVMVPVIEAVVAGRPRPAESGVGFGPTPGAIGGFQGGRSLQDLVEELSLLLGGRPAAVAAQDRSILASTVPMAATLRHDLAVALAQGEFQAGNPRGWRVTAGGGGAWGDCWAYPISVEHRLLGFLLLGFGEAPAGGDALAVEHGIASVALALANHRATAEAAWRMQSELLVQLLSGEVKEDEKLEPDAAALGWSLRGSRVAVVIELHLHPGTGLAERVELMRTAAEAVSGAFLERTGEKRAPAGSFEGTVVSFPAVIPSRRGGEGGDLEREQAAGTVIMQALKHTVGVPFQCGIGPPFQGVAQLRHSWSRARLALDIGKTIHPERELHFWDEIDLFHIASLVADTDAARELHTRIVKPLADHDALRHGKLLPTLEALITAGGNRTVAARQLYLHRGTVKYRIERMADLLGFDPLAPRMLPKVALALALWRLGYHPFDQTAQE
ncbi:MAG: PucR family transcriptional regulator ligand-binding domain-containing protein [Bacillota bacterium]|nr:PucR family transcriptional regulator ligand-binding domain-containing protein [Bacillota bacterium]